MTRAETEDLKTLADRHDVGLAEIGAALQEIQAGFYGAMTGLALELMHWREVAELDVKRPQQVSLYRLNMRLARERWTA